MCLRPFSAVTQTVREVLGVPGDLNLLYGIWFGYAVATANRVRMDRADLAESVTFHD